MPIIVSLAIRYIIMAAVQLGIWSLIEKYGLPLLNKAVIEIMQFFGVDEQTAKDIMANKIIVAFEQVGIFAVTLRTKMPIKVAEYLGFTSKGYALRKISSVAAQKAELVAISATSKTIATTAEVAKVAEVVSKTSGWAIKGVGDLLKYVTLLVGTPVGFFYALAQYVDYGAWQNPYQSTFQKLLSYIGISPDEKLASAKTISAEVWKRIYSTIEQLKPLGISFPFTNEDKPYSRTNLAAVVDEIAANMVKSGTQPTYKNVMASLLLTLQFNGQEPGVPTFPANSGGSSSSSSSSTSKATSIPTTKVFTGIVSQGVVGSGLSFQARPDDLIESVDELRAAAANNLAPFLAALPAKVVYEVKVVSSVTTKDGFKQTGQAQRIQTGTNKSGQPTYKTVVNKFATLILYILTDKGTRTKLTTIVLGPVDSAKLTVGQNDLRTLETSLPALVTTQDIKDITGINTPTSVEINGNPVVPAPGSAGAQDYGEDTGYRFYKFSVNGEEYLEVLPWLGNIPFDHTMITKEEFLAKEKALVAANPARWAPFFKQQRDNNPNAFAGGPSGYIIKDGVPYFVGGAPAPATAPVVSGGSTASPKTKATATTLFEWYQAQGQSLPSVSERAKKYAELGLGQSSYYTGTTEQNTKLLNALKGSPNVSSFTPPTFLSEIDGNALRAS